MLDATSARGTGSQALASADLFEVGRFLARRWRLIFGSALIFCLVALIVCLCIRPSYVATSQIVLDPPRPRVLSQDERAPENMALDSSVVDSQIPIIISNRNLAHVVERENLADDSDYSDSSRPDSDRRTTSSGGVNPNERGLAPIIRRFAEHVDVSRLGRSNVVSINVSSYDPDKAARLADAVAEAYVSDQVDLRVKSVQQAAGLFKDRLEALRSQVRASENAIAAYRKRNGLATTTDEKIIVSDQQLSNFDERLVAAASETALKLAKYQQARRFENGEGDLSTLLDVIQSTVINQLRSQLSDVRRKEADLLSSYGQSFPDVIKIQAQRRVLEVSVTTEIRRLASMLKNDYDVAKAREEALRAQIAELVTPSGNNPNAGVELRELQRANLANKALFENFLSKAKLTQEQPPFELPDSRIISQALKPSTPAFPKIKVVVPLAAVAGLLCGVAAAFSFDKLGTGRPVRAPARSGRTKSFGEGLIFGSVSADGPGGRKRFDGTAEDVDFNDRYADPVFKRSIESIAGKLAGLSTGGGLVVMLIPFSEGAGCSTIMQYLVPAFGRLDKRVLLIDADPTRRTLSKTRNLASHAGLGEVLQGAMPIGSAVVPQLGFAFIPVGQVLTAASVETYAVEMGSVLEEARKRFDIVMIDGPAYDSRLATSSWAGLADLLSIVCRQDHLTEDHLKAQIDDFADIPNFCGLIVNRMGTAASDDDQISIAS